MTDARIRAARLFLDQASARLSRATGVNQRVVQRWLSGARAVPDDVADWMARQDAAAAAAGLPERLREFADAAAVAGVHPEVLGAHLAALHREVTGRDVE